MHHVFTSRTTRRLTGTPLRCTLLKNRPLSTSSSSSPGRSFASPDYNTPFAVRALFHLALGVGMWEKEQTAKQQRDTRLIEERTRTPLTASNELARERDREREELLEATVGKEVGKKTVTMRELYKLQDARKWRRRQEERRASK
ncbi:hypothetical protein JCM8547_005748 [Rhodosporidiobolus lusitaniae]